MFWNRLQISQIFLNGKAEEMNSDNRNTNARAAGRPGIFAGYASAQGFFWALRSALTAFAALFLQEKGGLYAVILYRVLAAADMFLLVSCLYPGSVRTASLMKLNFYTYAVHYLIIRAALMAVRGMFGDGPAPLFLLYVLLPPLCLAGAAASAAVLRRLSPRLFRVLTGGRCG